MKCDDAQTRIVMPDSTPDETMGMTGSQGLTLARAMRAPSRDHQSDDEMDGKDFVNDSAYRGQNAKHLEKPEAGGVMVVQSDNRGMEWAI